MAILKTVAQEASDQLDGFSAHRLATSALGIDGDLRVVHGEVVSADYFTAVRPRLSLGRAFTKQDSDTPESALVA